MGMFAELAQLAGQGAVIFSVGRAGGDQLTVTIQPVGASANTAFQVSATASQLDSWLESGALLSALGQYREQQVSLAEVVEATKAVMEAQKKEAVAKVKPKAASTPASDVEECPDDESGEDDVGQSEGAGNPVAPLAKPAVKSIFG